jgi:hypothetical protein
MKVALLGAGRSWAPRWSPILLTGTLLPSSGPLLPLPWGAEGHHIVTRAAVSHLPAEMPAFFRSAGNQLDYLGPEPDRWRSRELKEMDDAWEFDHYIDLENVPEGALESSDRYEFIAALYAAGIDRPQQFVGFLPWRILEMYQRLLTEFAIWRNLEGDSRRPFVEARVLNDAGILGHYAADAAQPHHTTIHFNGWAEGAANPRGFTTARDFHARFESAFVESHVTFQDVNVLMGDRPMTIASPRESIWAHIRESNAAVERMYELEMEHGFDPETSPDPAVTDFVVHRLLAGAEMLRGLWWSAWTESEGLAARRRAQGWPP